MGILCKQMWTTQKNRIKQQQRTKAITCHQTQFKVLYHFGIRCKYAPSPCLNKSSMLSKCFCTSSSGLGKKAKSDCKHLKGKANTRKLLDFLLTQTIGVTTWNLICQIHFVASLPGSLSIEHSCIPANCPTTIFSSSAGPGQVLQATKSYEGLAASFQSQMGSKFSTVGLRISTQTYLVWFEEHLWNHMCCTQAVQKGCLAYGSGIHAYVCQPMCNWKTRTKYFDISTVESI